MLHYRLRQINIDRAWLDNWPRLQYSHLTGISIGLDHLFNCSEAIVALGYHHVIHSICVSVDFLYICIGFQSKKLTLKVTKGQFQVKVMSKQNSQLITMVQFPTLSDISIKSYWQKTVFDPDLDLQSHDRFYENIPLLHTQLVAKYQMCQNFALKVIANWSFFVFSRYLTSGDPCGYKIK